MLLNKISKKKIKVGIVGLGYVGLPRALQFSEKNVSVIGFDNDKTKIKKLNSGRSYITNISSEKIKKNISRKKLITTNNFSLIKITDVIILCLPTPLKKNLDPDLSYINETFNGIKKYLRKDQLLILESTSYPGTTYENIVQKLNKKFLIGKNFFVGYSPERNDPGLTHIKINEIPKLVSGYTKKCLNLTNSVYKIIFNKTVVMSSLQQAEMTKIYENIYRSVNICFVNEMKKICTKMNLDINEIIKSAKTKPFGFHPFYPGPGLGGHCIPIDPFYLTWKAKQFNIKTEFINLAGKVNRSIPSWVITQLKKSLNTNNIKNKKILILGIAYKKNINDCRESPAFEIIKILKENKVSFDFSDPFISVLPKMRHYSFQGKKGIVINEKNLKKYDSVILLTDHDKFNYKLIQKNSKLIIDTRNKFPKKYNVIYA